ncbi:M48 family metalloprotease [Maricaulis maris]|uniref:Putative Zn-dependent protease n=1 Tax=Maricaulis maris TaxID=74318 RepID=A0A495DKC7_9PROT|nr:M48 family metalloprotease [Maricaulis maris]RKR03063.1 putative Zn-dependent protease [Maricaulis maris]
MSILKTVATACVLAVATQASSLGQSLIRDTEIEHMLRDYSDPILEAAGLVPADVDLYIVADPELNAFVTGGQNIFLHTGIILESETPNQLKGVIAHEAGHISGAHLARVGDGISAAQAPMFVSLGLGVLAALAGEGGAAGALLASSQQFGALSFMTYSRAQEASADQAGLQFLEASGQSGEGLVQFFERFRYQEVMSNARRYPYFRSHPLSSERIANLRGGASESPFYDVQDSPEEMARLARIQGKIYGFLAEPEFVFYRYPESDQSLPARYARAVAHYHDARLDRALSEIQGLLDEEPENPYFHELHGQMLFESGHADEAIAPHARSVELEPTAPLLRVNLAIAMIATDNPDHLEEAAQHLRVALDIEPDNGFAWYQLSIIHERNGDTALAQLAIAEQSYAAGNRPRAHQFASRARTSLEVGTPAWVRATEIEAVSVPSEAELRQARRQRRN